jgi:glucokinase
MVRYVAGDIGGTNSRLQLVELPETDGGINQELEHVIAEETYPSQQYASLTFIIQKFLAAVSTQTHRQTGRQAASLQRLTAAHRSRLLIIADCLLCCHLLLQHNPAPAEPAIACCLAVAGPVRANKSIITNVVSAADRQCTASTPPRAIAC